MSFAIWDSRPSREVVKALRNILFFDICNLDQFECAGYRLLRSDMPDQNWFPRMCEILTPEVRHGWMCFLNAKTHARCAAFNYFMCFLCWITYISELDTISCSVCELVTFFVRERLCLGHCKQLTTSDQKCMAEARTRFRELDRLGK